MPVAVSVPQDVEFEVSLSVEAWGFGEVSGVEIDSAPSTGGGGAYIALAK